MRIGKLVCAITATLWLLSAMPVQADVVYSVRNGDTLDRISSKHGVSSERILEANPKLKSASLKTGQVIVIPDADTEEVADQQLASSAPQPNVVKLQDYSAELNRAGDRHRSAIVASRGGTTATRLLYRAHQFIGTPYSMGATGNGAFDCSGFTMRVFALFGVNLPRTADVQYNCGKAVPSGQERAGDLVFFETYLPGPSHVGIYVGNRTFIHASSSRGVTISSLQQPYYAARYLGAKRVL